MYVLLPIFFNFITRAANNVRIVPVNVLYARLKAVIVDFFKVRIVFPKILHFESCLTKKITLTF